MSDDKLKVEKEFFDNLLKNSIPNSKTLKSNDKKTAILVSKDDEDLYDWAKNG